MCVRRGYKSLPCQTFWVFIWSVKFHFYLGKVRKFEKWFLRHLIGGNHLWISHSWISTVGRGNKLASPGGILFCSIPVKTHSLSTLHTVLSTGSPLKPTSFDYVYSCIKEDVLLGSISGKFFLGVLHTRIGCNQPKSGYVRTQSQSQSTTAAFFKFINNIYYINITYNNNEITLCLQQHNEQSYST